MARSRQGSGDRILLRLAAQRHPPPSRGAFVTCSCSGAVTEDSFLRILALRGAGSDHPFALECPKTRYLKVAVLQVR